MQANCRIGLALENQRQHFQSAVRLDQLDLIPMGFQGLVHHINPFERGNFFSGEILQAVDPKGGIGPGKNGRHGGPNVFCGQKPHRFGQRFGGKQKPVNPSPFNLIDDFGPGPDLHIYFQPHYRRQFTIEVNQNAGQPPIFPDNHMGLEVRSESQGYFRMLGQPGLLFFSQFDGTGRAGLHPKGCQAERQDEKRPGETATFGPFSQETAHAVFSSPCHRVTPRFCMSVPFSVPPEVN